MNLGNGTPERAADEASFVSATLGERLVCFQFSSEPDLFYRGGRLRPLTYGYTAYAEEWQKFYKVVKPRIPNAKFAGPGTSGMSTWVVEFAQQFGKEVSLLTTHYYAEGPPTDPSMTIDRLLRANPLWYKEVPKVRRAMAESHLPYRLTETNSCYDGGRAGVGNTFASALWALDLMFQLVSFGGSGINFHGGGYGLYAPIVGTIENGFVTRPEYYALLLFSQLLGGRMVANQVDASAGGPLFVCYSAKDAKGQLRTVVINKDAQKDVRLTVKADAPGERIAVQRLVAPDLKDTTDATFAGSPVGAEGAWKASITNHYVLRNGVAECMIGAGSAVLLSWI